MSEWKNGSAMVAMIVVIAILSLLGAVLFCLAGTEIGSAKNFNQGISAQYVAEAGLRRGLVVLIENGDPQGLSESLQGLGQSASYQIIVVVEGTRKRIRSTGVVGDARRTVSAEISRAGSAPLTDYALISSGSLDLGGDVVVHGPVLAGGPTGISGNSVSLSTPVEKARIGFPGFSMQSQVPLETPQGILRQELSLNGLTFVSQDTVLVLDGAATHVRGPGILWARGDLVIRGATVDDGVVIVSDGNIFIEGHSRLVSAFVAAPHGWVEISGDGVYLSGGIWARQHIDVNATGTLLTANAVSMRAALDRLGVPENRRQPYVINSWGI